MTVNLLLKVDLVLLKSAVRLSEKVRKRERFFFFFWLIFESRNRKPDFSYCERISETEDENFAQVFEFLS